MSSIHRQPDRSPTRPNIVLILADDLGFGDIGCYNPASRIPTPNIDSLAESGVRWTDMHTPSAVCTPSRYGMLTGQYCWRDKLSRGVLYGYEPPLIGSEQPTLAGVLRDAGYETACIGKWHLGMEFSTKVPGSVDFTRPLPWKGVDTDLESRINLAAPIGGGPITRGFNEFFGTAGCSTAQPPFAFIDQDRFVETPSEFREKIHFTGRPGMTSPGWDHADADPTFAKRAVSTVMSHKERTDPFFLYLAASAPHEPCLEATVPEFARGRSKAGHRGDLVWLFDWMVGRVIETLVETGQAENTLVIVTSDNGALPGDRVNISPEMDGYELYNHSSCGDWRGYKAHIWEGGHRVPFVVGRPAGTSAAQHRVAGDSPASSRSVVTNPACLTDLFVTLPRLANANPGAGGGEDSLDLSWLPGFSEWLPDTGGPQGESGKDGPGSESSGGARSTTRSRSALIHHSGNGVFSLREGDWKLIADSGGSGGWPPPAGTVPVPGEPGQLYNLKEDPGESVNLWESSPETVAGMLEQLALYRSGRPTVA